MVTARESMLTMLEVLGFWLGYQKGGGGWLPPYLT